LPAAELAPLAVALAAVGVIRIGGMEASVFDCGGLVRIPGYRGGSAGTTRQHNELANAGQMPLRFCQAVHSRPFGAWHRVATRLPPLVPAFGYPPR
jgi:hypothetical protein